jgi:nitroreductase
MSQEADGASRCAGDVQRGPLSGKQEASARETAVQQFFEGPRELDRLSLLAPDCEWWNGLGRLPGAEGQTTFTGRDEIGRVLLARGGVKALSTGETVDRYDLATSRCHDVLTISDGPYVFRQHRYTATTVGGRAYENHYGFLFRFRADGLIDRIWEHWGTLAAWQQLFRKGPDGLVVHDPDTLLTTAPAVRKRLDLTRPVERSLVEECLQLAVHAPNGSNTQPYRFVFVDDPERKAALADLYRDAMASFQGRTRTDAPEDNVDRTGSEQQRIAESVFYLRDHLHEVPVLLVPCVAGRTDGHGAGEHAARTDAFWQASRWGAVIPTVWSLILALRSRGLGSAWTTLTLAREREVAELLGIPYEHWMQAGLFPIAHTIGTDFRRPPRRPAAEFMSWNDFRTRGNRGATPA